MNRIRVWGVAALGALAAAAAARAVAADSPAATTTDDRPWYVRMFVSPPAQSGPVTPTNAPIAAVPGLTHAGSALSPEMVAEARKAEQDAWQRRMAVCLKLREAAITLNDKRLERTAEELERQVDALYKQRVAALGLPKVKAALPAPPSGPAVTSLDLGPTIPPEPKPAPAPLVAPGQPVPVSGAASLPPAREVNP
jgi:hypothetical protein